MFLGFAKKLFANSKIQASESLLPLLTAIFILTVVFLFALTSEFIPAKISNLQEANRSIKLSYRGIEREAISQLEAGLRADDNQTVLLSAISLESLPIKQLKEEMISLKERGFEEAYIRVLPELYALSYEKALEDLKNYALSDELTTTQIAIEQLARLPPLTAVEELQENLSIPHDQMVYHVGRVLRKWRRANDKLLDLLRTINKKRFTPEGRLYAAITLISLNAYTDEAWKTIDWLVKIKDEENANRLALYLGDRSDPQSYKVLLQMLEDPENRVPALRALVHYDYPDKVDKVSKYEILGNTYQRFLVLINLASSGEEFPLKDAFERLIEKHSAVLSEFTTALREWEDPKALPYYDRMVKKNPSRIVRVGISQNLRAYPLNARAIFLARKLLEMSEDSSETTFHLKTLGLIGTRREKPLLFNILRKSKDTQTRIVSSWAILNIDAGLPINTPSQPSI